MFLKISTYTELPVTQCTLVGLLSSVDEKMCLQATGEGEVLAADCTLQWMSVYTAMLLQPAFGSVGLATLLTLQATGGCWLGEAHSDENWLSLQGVRKSFKISIRV